MGKETENVSIHTVLKKYKLSFLSPLGNDLMEILMITQPKDYCKSIELILTIIKNLFSPKNAEWLFLFQQRSN